METLKQLGKIAKDFVDEIDAALQPIEKNNQISHNHHLKCASLALSHLPGQAREILTREKLTSILARLYEFEAEALSHGWEKSEAMQSFREQLKTALGIPATSAQK